MSAQEYIETYKIGVYLQDAIKIILDRREEKPLDLFLEYLNTTLKGEHVLLREYAFVSATPLNRRCFRQQVKKVFHSTPYYKILTALDYHQMLCLICSDFPRSLMIETVKTLSIANTDRTSEQAGEQILFEQYELGALQSAVCVFFYFNEFLENLRQIFQESQQSSALNIYEQCSCYTLYQSVHNFIQRQKPNAFPLPSREQVLEVLMCKQGIVE